MKEPTNEVQLFLVMLAGVVALSVFAPQLAEKALYLGIGYLGARFNKNPSK